MSSYPPDLTEKSDLISGSRATRRKNRFNPSSSLVRIAILSLLAVLLVVVLVVAVTVVVHLAVERNTERGDSASGTYSKAAVAADAAVCSTAGVEILKKGGSAVDAAIAAHLCNGVVNLHSTGIGGGGFMVFYNATSDESFALDFREVAGGNASVYMYNGTAEDSHRRGTSQYYI